MELQGELSKMRQFRTAILLAGSVALVLFTILSFVMLSGLYSEYETAVAQHIQVEQDNIESYLKPEPGNSIRIPNNIFNKSLVGLVIVSEKKRLLLDAGNTLGFTQSKRIVPKSGFVTASLWKVASNTGTLTVVAYINTKADLMSLSSEALKLLAFAMVASLIAGAIIFFFTYRFYLLPMRRLIKSLRSRREQSKTELHELLSVPKSADFQPLAEEINKLIEGQRRSARLVKVKQQYLEFAAHHDPMTHLPNRLMFEEALKKTVRSATKQKRPFSVFIVDLDNFKHFNDQYGHLIGDAMVTEVGSRLRAQISEVDVVARLDGDEFAVIQQDISDISSTQKFARRLMLAVTEPFEHQGFTMKVAASVGIARFPDDVLHSQHEELLGEEIVNNATVALQQAKILGKGQFQLFTEQMRSVLTERIHLERDLKVALQEEQFEVFYQPKINMHTRQCTGAEALVRWNHPVRGFVSPDDFVPLAEETGLIIELGEWILRTACFKTRDLHALGYKGLNVAVNISAVQFTDGNLLPMVTKALRDSQINPELLELEITESAVMNDPAEVIRSLHQLSQHGMKLAIDDFGTGYSSLAYLKKFPVDTLKIDKAFVTDVSSDNDDVAIVEAVLGLGKHFNMKVVAEGIEDEAQLEFLKSRGCDIAQGYYISKPMEADLYAVWLEAWPYGVQEAVDTEFSPTKIFQQPRTGTDG